MMMMMIFHTSSRCLWTSELTNFSRSSTLESVEPSSMALRDSARFNGKKSYFSWISFNVNRHHHHHHHDHQLQFISRQSTIINYCKNFNLVFAPVSNSRASGYPWPVARPNYPCSHSTMFRTPVTYLWITKQNKYATE